MQINWPNIFTSYIGSLSPHGVFKAFRKVTSATNPYRRGTDDAKAFDELNQLLTHKYSANPLQNSAVQLLERLNSLQQSGLIMGLLTLEHLAVYDEAYKITKAYRPAITSALESLAVKLINAGYTPETFTSVIGDFTYLISKSSQANAITFKDSIIKLLDEVKSPPRVVQAYASTYRGFFDLGWLENNGDGQLMTLFTQMSKLKPHPAMLKTFEKDLASGRIERDRVFFLLKELAIHSGGRILQEAKSDAEFTAAANSINAIGIIDHAPYKNSSPEAKQYHNETRKVQRRLNRVYHAFGALTYEAKRSNPQNPNSLSLLAQFGRDLFDDALKLHNSEFDQYPGNGFMFNGVIPEHAFVADPGRPDDQFHTYKKEWPWAASVFDDLLSASVIFTRGFMAVSSPGNENYTLDGTHYTYYVPNDHLFNHGLFSGLLIPTSMFFEKLKGTAIPFSMKGTPSTKSLHEAKLEPLQLISAAKNAKLNVINIGSGSCIGGGLCNGYPINSSPHYTWEIPRRRHEFGEFEDYAGHIHKSHKEGGYEQSLGTKILESIAPLRRVHENVYRVTDRYQNLFDLIRIAHAMWHKGLTLDAESLDENVELTFDAPASDFDSNPGPLRMLIEAYNWHAQTHRGIYDVNQFPILTIAHATNYLALPNPKVFRLDTYDLTATIGDEKFSLSKDGIKLREQKLWYDRVISQIAEDPLADLRFYDRRMLSGIVQEEV